MYLEAEKWRTSYQQQVLLLEETQRRGLLREADEKSSILVMQQKLQQAEETNREDRRRLHRFEHEQVEDRQISEDDRKRHEASFQQLARIAVEADNSLILEQQRRTEEEEKYRQLKHAVNERDDAILSLEAENGQLRYRLQQAMSETSALQASFKSGNTCLNRYNITSLFAFSLSAPAPWHTNILFSPLQSDSCVSCNWSVNILSLLSFSFNNTPHYPVS